MRTKRRKIEISNISGLVRVTIRPSLHWFWALFEIAGLLFFSQVIYRNWHALGPANRALFTFALISSALSLLYVQTGSEIIEFAPERLTITKELRGWERKRDYQIEDCSELQLHEHSESDRDGLECKVGWKRITFGRNISEEEAVEILTALQRTLPGVAQKLCSLPAGSKHFITLG